VGGSSPTFPSFHFKIMFTSVPIVLPDLFVLFESAILLVSASSVPHT
jgi:hypothetical protein